MMKEFFLNLKKYFKYARYAAKCELRTEVANSYLNWLWWILEPLAFMLIYMFVAKVVFNTKEAYFSVFVFVGITTWTFFNWMILGSVKLILNNRSIVSKIYIPKYIIILKKSLVYLFKTFISYFLMIILMIFLRVPFSLTIIWFIPIFCVFYIVVFGAAMIFMHFGVYLEDLLNITNIVLKMTFYLSGVFYSILKNVPEPFNKILLIVNPAAFTINQMRKVLLYNKNPDFNYLMMWLLIGILLNVIGIKIIQKYENSYAKVM